MSWLRSFGTLAPVGIEGTGVYSAGLARRLAQKAWRRWNRPAGPHVTPLAGKPDPADAYATAHTAWSRRRTDIPKQRDGQAQALHSLRVVARRSALQHRADLVRRIKALVITAPDEARTALRYLSRGVNGPNSAFRLKYLEPYAEAAHTWLQGEAEVINTTHLTPAQAALQIAEALKS
ncbi:hypothetical protein AB0G85_37170 [Streptomyces sioyaensis]|uniref:hypothetical protein n=1 Tax=Streptomyces sioyaensis TaxID=67364 RepID=UPI0034040DFC